MRSIQDLSSLYRSSRFIRVNNNLRKYYFHILSRSYTDLASQAFLNFFDKNYKVFSSDNKDL